MKFRFEIGYTVSVIVICLGILFSNFTNNRASKEVAPFVQYYFAFNINPSQNTGIINYAVVGVSDGRIVNKKFLSLKDFLLQGMGLQQSPANSLHTDLFEQFELSDCFYKYDSIEDVYSECFTLKDIWSLRYNRNPVCPTGCIPTPGMKLEGWAQGKFHPSWPQIQILQQYGVIQDSDFFYGENMFKLFKDMEDPQWVENYKAAI